MSDMTEIDVPDWVVEQAFNAWCDVADVDEWRVRNSHEALKAALRAAWSAWAKEVGYATIGNTTGNTLRIDKIGEGRSAEEANEYWAQHGFHTERAFTLRQEKPE